ncbi:GNAT family N-acetyltransferase [Cellulomonas fimi]|uniref:GCN5-related N-acetyltransferase n=1 Tax=Cellulomonas fimi (strain ATCC 484 / DSM 20113 / JCM 1341 / CCUG 24087 / LMG 16345 / NBRC 15513 / NCIMB 8980 / NCTC 7547 / NRS-133) TaxID=590998 RepID=F4H5Y0_CELFA|nr:GNAT family N-acetyltransferase [Cellulomonas fimi]AEE46710.1 GCN5-related N-acetyltransferase [Cellulomonas fimi ATCC 484]NNH07645.1 GNAT family N-acetyltransferase [Cellulomonas fimi]
MVIDVRPALGRFDDFATVVGPKGPGVQGCWCMSIRDGRIPPEERPAVMRDQCATDPGPGVLVYVDDEVAGWCSVAPRSTYRRLMRSRTLPFVDECDPWSVACFVVRPGFRKRGLMHVLLDGAVEHARAHGAQVVEGYPVETAGTRVDTVSGYVGTVELFEASGFEVVAPTTSRSGHRPRVVVRREL